MLPKYVKSWLYLATLLAAAPAFGHVAPAEYSAPPVIVPILLAQNDWNNLSEQEKQLLRNHQQQWNNYPPDYRSRLRQGVDRYQGLSPEERDRLQRGREQYKALPPDEREQLKRKYRERQER